MTTATSRPGRVTRYKRWIDIGDNNTFLRTLRRCKRLGVSIVDGGKPGFCAWYGLCVQGTAEQIRELESWWSREEIGWHKRQPRGAWPVSDKGAVIPWETVWRNVS